MLVSSENNDLDFSNPDYSVPSVLIAAFSLMSIFLLLSYLKYAVQRNGLQFVLTSRLYLLHIMLLIGTSINQVSTAIIGFYALEEIAYNIDYISQEPGYDSLKSLSAVRYFGSSLFISAYAGIIWYRTEILYDHISSKEWLKRMASLCTVLTFASFLCYPIIVLWDFAKIQTLKAALNILANLLLTILDLQSLRKYFQFYKGRHRRGSDAAFRATEIMVKYGALLVTLNILSSILFGVMQLSLAALWIRIPIWYVVVFKFNSVAIDALLVAMQYKLHHLNFEARVLTLSKSPAPKSSPQLTVQSEILSVLLNNPIPSANTFSMENDKAVSHSKIDFVSHESNIMSEISVLDSQVMNRPWFLWTHK